MKRFLVNLGIYVGVPASLCTLYQTYVYFSHDASKDARFGMALLAAFAGIFLLLTVIAEYRFSRKARYAEALHLLHRAYNLCIETQNVSIVNAKELTRIIQSICTLVAQTFNLVTATRCACCVKVIDQPHEDASKEEPQLSFSTLCRDNASVDRETRKVAHRKTNQVTHWLHRNSAFVWIFDHLGKPPLQEVFFENNLISRPDYQNTSFDIYGKPSEIRWIRSIARRFTWRLPYKSTIIAPVTLLEDDQVGPLIAFLAIDSASRNVFKRRYDIDIVHNLAKALYPIILKWFELKSTIKDIEQEVYANGKVGAQDAASRP